MRSGVAWARLKESARQDFPPPWTDWLQMGWEPGQHWRVFTKGGTLRCETNIEEQALDAMQPGDRVYRSWRRCESEFRFVAYLEGPGSMEATVDKEKQ